MKSGRIVGAGERVFNQGTTTTTNYELEVLLSVLSLSIIIDASLLTQKAQRHVSSEAQCSAETECAAYQITMVRPRGGDIPYIAGPISFAAIIWLVLPSHQEYYSGLLPFIARFFFISLQRGFSVFSFFLDHLVISTFWTPCSVHISTDILNCSLYISHTQSHHSTPSQRLDKSNRNRHAA